MSLRALRLLSVWVEVIQMHNRGYRWYSSESTHNTCGKRSVNYGGGAPVRTHTFALNLGCYAPCGYRKSSSDHHKLICKIQGFIAV